MSLFRRFFILLPMPLCALACAPRSASISAPHSTPRIVSVASSDIDRLGQLIALPRRPQSVAWRQVQRGDGDMSPSDYTVRAVLLFDATDLKKIAVRPSAKAAPTQSETPIESWFPEALKKKATPNASGQLMLRCARLVPEAFFKNSLRNGDLLQPGGTRYVILSLFTT